MLEHVKKEKLIKHEGLCSKVTDKSTHVSKQKKKAETKVFRGWKQMWKEQQIKRNNPSSFMAVEEADYNAMNF